MMLVWKGGEHRFRLGIGELRALQQSCDAGPLYIWGRLIGNQWFVDDVREPIRLGLIGGGMEEKEAARLVNKAFDDHAFYAHVLVATQVLAAAIFGEDAEDNPSGEAEARAKMQESDTRATKSSSPSSTVPESPLD